MKKILTVIALFIAVNAFIIIHIKKKYGIILLLIFLFSYK